MDELRAVAPRPRSARWLAERFEVSVRTVERDVSALQQRGVPIWAEPGRTGGYCVSREHTLPPINFTPGEALAMAVALQAVRTSPFRTDAEGAMRKIVGAMTSENQRSARELAGRVHFLHSEPPLSRLPRALTGAAAVRTGDVFAELSTSCGTLAIGSSRTGPALAPGAAEPGRNRSVIVEFLTRDVDADYARLRDAVHSWVNEPTDMPWGNRSLLLRDPDGNLVNLFTPVAPEAKAKFARFAS